MAITRGLAEIASRDQPDVGDQARGLEAGPVTLYGRTTSPRGHGPGDRQEGAALPACSCGEAWRSGSHILLSVGTEAPPTLRTLATIALGKKAANSVQSDLVKLRGSGGLRPHQELMAQNFIERPPPGVEGVFLLGSASAKNFHRHLRCQKGRNSRKPGRPRALCLSHQPHLHFGLNQLGCQGGLGTKAFCIKSREPEPLF